MFVLAFMATKAAVPPTAAVSNETADAANAGMPKAHQPKQMHKQACEEPPAHNRTHEAHAHINAGTAQAQHEHEATQQHRTTAQQKRTIHIATPTSEFCAPVAARLNVNLEQDVDFCPGSSKSQDANLAGMLRVRPNVGYGERILASASS